MAIPEGYKRNYETLLRAAKNNDLAMACVDRSTGKPVMAICAVNRDNGDYIFAPLAKLFDGNPYEELLSPSQMDEAGIPPM